MTCYSVRCRASIRECGAEFTASDSTAILVLTSTASSGQYGTISTTTANTDQCSLEKTAQEYVSFPIVLALALLSTPHPPVESSESASFTTNGCTISTNRVELPVFALDQRGFKRTGMGRSTQPEGQEILQNRLA